MFKKIFIVVVVMLAFVGIIALLTTSGDKTQPARMEGQSSSTKADEQIAENTIEISNFAFKPGKITVKKGTTVTWINNDPTKHNVIFDDESAGKVEDSKLISKGEKLQYSFETTGKFPYHCQPHPYMTASIEVVE